jgi:hypothetical protein
MDQYFDLDESSQFSQQSTSTKVALGVPVDQEQNPGRPATWCVIS